MVTHERDAAERADRILTLADGRLHADEDLRALRVPQDQRIPQDPQSSQGRQDRQDQARLRDERGQR
jgi:putative ABC transport system ATP-binding protein